MSSINQKCPCGSGLKYKKCCKAYHDGKLPQNALFLMKSRYSAYAMKETSYIEKTTHKITENLEEFRKSIKAFCNLTDFEKLTILEFVDGESEAYISFHAKLTSSGKDISFTEKSRFLKVDGIWYYADGVMLQ